MSIIPVRCYVVWTGILHADVTTPIKTLPSSVAAIKPAIGRWVPCGAFHALLLGLLLTCPARAGSQATNSLGDSPFTLVFQHHQGFVYEGQMEWRELVILTNGTAWGRAVRSPAKDQTGLREKRYKIELTAEELRLLRAELDKAQFMTMTNHARTNVTRVLKDEAGYSISLKLVSGRRHDFYWAEGDGFVPHFFPLGDHLYSIFWRIARTTPVYSGKFERAWRPEGRGR